MTKVCVKCGEEKPETKDFFRPNPIRGLRNDCRDCERKARREYHAKNSEKMCSAARKWYYHNKEQHNKSRRERYAKDPSKFLIAARKHRYGITEEGFQNLLSKQNNRCAICNFEFSFTPCVDHCHTSKIVRGLLCKPCNSYLGVIGDSKEILQKAIEYLQKNS